jgi:hypothetical protein
LLADPFMGRRLAALAGFVAVVALALVLLYRVWLHHRDAEPYVEEAPAVVDASISAKFSRHLR